MDGSTFVFKLQSLAIPYSEHLRGDDFDWVFLNESSQPLSQFWRWFVTNISPDNILQEEEIENYEDLLASGSVLSGSHLEQIESYLGPVSAEQEDGFSLNLKMNEMEEDVDKLKDSLKKLQTKKNFLSLQKLEVEEEVRVRRESVQHLRQELESQKRCVQAACSEHSRALERISLSIDAASAPLIPFAREGEKAAFVSQLSSNQWEHEETVLKDAIVTFIYKQFHEGFDRLAGEANTTSYCLMDSGQLASLQFVRGPGQARHQMQVKELSRLNTMLETTEVEAAQYELLKAQKDAEVGEALRFIKTLRSRSRPPVTFVRQQTASLQETMDSLHRDAQTQRQLAAEEASLVAQGERRRFLSFSYEIKLQRQAYFLSKLKMVKEFVLHRDVRISLAKIALDIERRRVRRLVEVIGRLHAFLQTRRHAHITRMEDMTLLKEFWLTSDAATREEREALKHLLRPLWSHTDLKSDRDVSRLVSQLELSLKASDHELESASEAQLACLNRLYFSCGQLEECLFGACGSACELPRTWVGVAAAEWAARVEAGVWQLQQRMLDALRDYERKKKLIKDSPSIESDLVKWTQSVPRKVRS